VNVSAQGEHGVVLIQTMHLMGRVARPYNTCVGVNFMFALARTATRLEIFSLEVFA
jgi:hypothetical protein